MIEEFEITKLDARLVKQIENAQNAVSTDIAYTLDVFTSILQQHPCCLGLRRKLRELQLRELSKSGNTLSGFLGKVTNSPFFKIGKSNENTTETLNKAEILIAKSPGNVIAHQMLAEAAKGLGMLKTAAFAFETIKQIQPNDLGNLKCLAEVYIELGDTENAIKIGSTIKQINPRDGDAEDIMKRASVAAAMHQGKWEESKDFRAQLKDESEAQSLEQESKSMNDSKGLEVLIRQTYEKVQQEPGDLNHYKKLSDYYHRYGDLQNAIAWIQHAREQEAGKGDVSLGEKEYVLTLEYFDDIIEQWDKACASDGDNQEWRNSLETAKNNKTQYQFQHFETLVQRYPNDYSFRFDLGILLFNDEKYDECLQHFQLAQRNAKVRLDAILYLGRAYSRKAFYDMAIEQFSILKEEIQVMDERKKEAVYELGNCYDQMGQKENAFEEYKLVYSADISFRDISDKVNSFYQSKANN